jgi:hypothetical protein
MIGIATELILSEASLQNDPRNLGWRRLPPVLWCKPVAEHERRSTAMASASWGSWVPARTIDTLVLLVVAVITHAGCDSPSDTRPEGWAPATEQLQSTGPSKKMARQHRMRDYQFGRQSIGHARRAVRH